jgi:hypothetical protein
MGPQLLPATASHDASGWQQTVMAFLAEKERRRPVLASTTKRLRVVARRPAARQSARNSAADACLLFSRVTGRSLPPPAGGQK